MKTLTNSILFLLCLIVATTTISAAQPKDNAYTYYTVTITNQLSGQARFTQITPTANNTQPDETCTNAFRSMCGPDNQCPNDVNFTLNPDETSTPQKVKAPAACDKYIDYFAITVKEQNMEEKTVWCKRQGTSNRFVITYKSPPSKELKCMPAN
jgi:hypothetical protein